MDPGPFPRNTTQILLINPNRSQATTDMMAAIARSAAPSGVEIVGATAERGVPMILDAEALAASSQEVLRIGLRLGRSVAGIIVSAFGDPGVGCLRSKSGIPVVGIAPAWCRVRLVGAETLGRVEACLLSWSLGVLLCRSS